MASFQLAQQHSEREPTIVLPPLLAMDISKLAKEDTAVKGQTSDQFNSPVTDVYPLEIVWWEPILK